MSFGKGITKNKSTKGDYAESLIENILIEKYNIYKPTGLKAHPFDGFIMKYTEEKIKVIPYDVKSKAARNKLKDTGVDYKHYKIYKQAAQQFKKFYIFFVDEDLGCIYYLDINKYISETKKFNIFIDSEGITYPRLENDGTYIYFSLETMVKIRDLTKDEIKILKNFSSTTNKKYTFNPTWSLNNIFEKK
jgi:hypothetical protein